MVNVVFSYSHADERLRNRLEVALATLKRVGGIETFHDRRITPGSDLDDGISALFERSDVILALLSPDFLASDYCYQREMGRALERHRDGTVRLIPIILRPCEWQQSPLGDLLALPEDGKPVSRCPDEDEAFLEISQGIRAALDEMQVRHLGEHGSGPQIRPNVQRGSPDPTIKGPLRPEPPRSSNLRIKQTYSEADRDRFKVEAFDFMARFFENSLEELKRRNPVIEASFRRIDAKQFTSKVYRDGEKVGFARVFMGTGVLTSGIAYASHESLHGGYNEMVTVRAFDDGMFLQSMGMSHRGGQEQRLTPEGAAELYWELLMKGLR